MRRGTDIVRPGSNIMLLADLMDSSAPPSHNFLYTWVLGAYHTNIIYTEPGVRATPKPASSMAHSTVTRALALWAHT